MPSNIVTPMENTYTSYNSATPSFNSRINNYQEDQIMHDVNSPKVIFLLAPSLNQIYSNSDNTRQIQEAIDRLASYLNRLQSNINQNISFTLKNYMTFEETQENRIDYQEIMLAILRNKDVRPENFYKFSEALQSYYFQCFDSIVPIAHVIVNVNYTRGKTKIVHSLTHFFNLCINYFVSSIFNILLEPSSVSSNNIIRPEYLEHIEDMQKNITNMYNFRLVDLQNTLFYKHTPDNDDNRFESQKATLPSDVIYDVAINVKLISNYLSF
ncbi:hypothetical protein [Rachiplusia nu nucleopolyhedrovirus]|uniref:Uncharacterized protein n=1 Tax=Rachiplusia nu nucleopolyhedrovirus TaxID=2605775 RepID=A0AAE6IQR4_9ABAC|nr:hypothetical protein QKQ55_gp043 [Rachiplusia nu nucleopolyhedrovirus]QEI03660.1 hypothetical protein [Rachiplusia nu nucleopolyhedrovirus]